LKEISVSQVTEVVRELCIKANYDLPEDVENLIRQGLCREESEFGCYALNQIIENVELARREQVALCQDTGLAVVYLEVGQDVHFTGGSLQEAINEGVRQGYKDGYLRKSAVSDPVFDRKNTGDNTPAIIHMDIVPGDKVKITVVPKGGGG
jgi:fumarate hydratase subunit alpha